MKRYALVYFSAQWTGNGVMTRGWTAMRAIVRWMGRSKAGFMPLLGVALLVSACSQEQETRETYITLDKEQRKERVKPPKLPVSPHVEAITARPTAEMERESIGVDVLFRTLDKRTLRVKEHSVRVGDRIEAPWGGAVMPLAYVPDLLIRDHAAQHGPHGHVNPAVWVKLTDQRNQTLFEGWLFSRDPALTAWEHPRFDLTFKGSPGQLAATAKPMAPPVATPATAPEGTGDGATTPSLPDEGIPTLPGQDETSHPQPPDLPAAGTSSPTAPVATPPQTPPRTAPAASPAPLAMPTPGMPPTTPTAPPPSAAQPTPSTAPPSPLVPAPRPPEPLAEEILRPPSLPQSYPAPASREPLAEEIMRPTPQGPTRTREPLAEEIMPAPGGTAPSRGVEPSLDELLEGEKGEKGASATQGPRATGIPIVAVEDDPAVPATGVGVPVRGR